MADFHGGENEDLPHGGGLILIDFISIVGKHATNTTYPKQSTSGIGN